MPNNVFNDEKKKEATKQELAAYFKTDERPVIERLTEWLGLSSEPNPLQPNVKPADYKLNSYWDYLKEEK